MDFPENCEMEDNSSDYDFNEEEIEEAFVTYNPIAYQQQSTQFICDTCEREFQTSSQYERHMMEHKSCNIDGCSFTAHRKIVDRHIQMQHMTGLYEKIKNKSTPEDIAKWIADRKKRYPTKENMEKRYKQQDEMLKRGEILKKNSRGFDKKNKTRLALVKQNKTYGHPSTSQEFNKNKQIKRKKILPKPKEYTSLIDSKSDWNGALHPFRGTVQLDAEERNDDMNKTIDDTEWIQEDKQDCDIQMINIVATQSIPKEEIKPTNALGALIAAYDSEDSEVEETKLESKTTNSLTDDEAPTEEKIIRLELPPLIEEQQKENQSRSKCDNKRRRGRRNDKTTSSSNITKGQQTTVYKKRRTTLLERLLENEINHERNVLLQCVRYVVQNGFFEDANN